MTVAYETGRRTETPFRFDNVGSFLRPDTLKDARKSFAAGTISRENLQSVEDEAIKDLISKQKEVGLKAITDGEFRRSWWHLDFMWGLQGVEKEDVDKGYQFKDEETRAETARLSGRISGENHPFIEHFKFVKQFEEEGVVARQTIPAPAQFLTELERPENKAATEAIYPDRNELLEDIAAAYQTFIRELYEAGCRNLQIDDCTWGLLVDENFWKSLSDNVSVEDLSRKHVTLNNKAIENHPADLTITTHVCRGNYHSTWASSGAYDKVAEVLFGEENVKAYYLEFDTERAGGFESLAKVSDDKLVVLGLFSSKFPELEDKEEIRTRIEEASKYVPLERLCVSPQCGFASTEEGNILTEEQQWDKLRLVREVAEEVWGK
ncbi:Methionine synthase II (cobalamin-independent) [Salinicoccus halodurans]|uniref:5-methyltetrahydropteroyltriglutamate--homocysteine methyltransferase n=2 Tax=Salinicoccus halodurans TaxID=407035 RepID=A0A0F7HN50_9STAP|nr:5-methyltetrahydropteroyltriglutamate--homocysteine S-methyltransferase [Salinicoccus halodurans]AKG74972.1 5-methyltetrahydropteroyltriglutamate--homocysteine methyltransferase [Salinicoccus halodurans]SFK67547.1 Methionine synthase II (cobalamin-independent) [Salinicoccus halodurans]